MHGYEYRFMKRETFVKYLFLLPLLFIAGGCKEKACDSYVGKIIDLTGDEEQVLKLKYDVDGNIIEYGDTPVEYDGDEIIVGKVRCSHSDDRLIGVTFKMGKGKARESIARGMLKAKDGSYLEVEKHTVYEYREDTINILSDYWKAAGHGFLKHVQGKYIFDKEGRLTEVITTSTEANDSVSSCHTYYNYDYNINYQANLYLQAYVVDWDGLDNFFYLLLNLGEFKNRTAMPNDIGYCMDHGLSTYNIHANYQLDDDNLIRIEALYNYTKLLSRINLFYLPSD